MSDLTINEFLLHRQTQLMDEYLKLLNLKVRGIEPSEQVWTQAELDQADAIAREMVLNQRKLRNLYDAQQRAAKTHTLASPN